MNTNEPHRLTAILFADMVGYSSLRQRIALQFQQEMLALAREELGTHRGRLVKTMGDGFLAEFPTATGAVRFAIELQDRLVRRNAEVKADQRFCLRIGVHFGEVVVRGDEIEGTNVVIAARTEPLAAPGGVCLTEPVWEQVHEELPRLAHRLGKLRVKGLKRGLCFYHIYAVDSGWAARWRLRGRLFLKWPGRLPAAIVGAGLLMGLALWLRPLAPDLLDGLFPPSPEQLVERARAQLEHFDESGHIQHAIRYLNEAVRRDRTSADAQAYLGLANWRLYRDTKDIEKRALAATCSSKALTHISNSVLADLVLGLVALDENHLTQATNHLHKANGHARVVNGEVLVQLATTYQRLEDPLKAAYFYQQIPQAQSNSWSVFNDLAIYEFQYMNPTAALASATQAVHLAPRSPWAWSTLGNLLLDGDRHHEALACFKKSSGFRPTPEALSGIGSVYFAQSNWLQAADSFLKAAKLKPSYYAFYGNAGRALLNVPGREAEAGRYLSNALDKADLFRGDTPGCLADANTGLYLAALGRSDEACVRLQRALEQCPNHAQVIANVGAAIEVFNRGGHREEANRFQRQLDNLNTK